MAILSTPLQYLASVPVVTRAWTAATIVFSLFYFWITWKTHSDYTPYITLVPGSSIFYPWTFLTAALVETSIMEVCISLLLQVMRILKQYAVLYYPRCCTSLITVSGTALGDYRNTEIYRRHRRGIEFHRICVWLDRIHRNKKCRSFSVRAACLSCFLLC